MSGSSLYGPFGITQTIPQEYARISNTQQTNLNASPIAWRNVTFNAGSLLTNIIGLGADGLGFTNVSTGVYYIFGSIRYTSPTLRTNLRLRLQINNVTSVVEGAGGYIRAANNNDTSSVNVADIININAISTVRLVGAQEGNTGTITTQANLGVLGLLRLG